MNDEDFTSDDVPNKRMWMNSRGGAVYGGMPAGNEPPGGVRPLMSMANAYPYMYPSGPAPYRPPNQYGGPYWRPPRGGFYDRPFDGYRHRGGHSRGPRPRYDSGPYYFRPQKRPYQPRGYFGQQNNRFESYSGWNSNANRAGGPQSGGGKWQCPHPVKSAHCMAVMLENPWENLERERERRVTGRRDAEEETASKLRDAKLEESGTEQLTASEDTSTNVPQSSEQMAYADDEAITNIVSDSRPDTANTSDGS